MNRFQLPVLLVAIALLTCTHPLWAGPAEDLAEGQKALAAGRMDEAVKLLQSAAEQLPASVEAQIALAQCHLRRGDFDKALESYRRALRLSPQHTEAKRMVAALTGGRPSESSMLAAARALIDLAQHDVAQRTLRELLQRPLSEANKHEARLMLAESQLLAGDAKAALGDAMELLQLSKDDAVQKRAHLIAALSILRQGEVRDRAEVIGKHLAAAAGVRGDWAKLHSTAELWLAASLAKEIDAGLMGKARASLAAAVNQPMVIDVNQRILAVIEQGVGKLIDAGKLDEATSLIWRLVVAGEVPGTIKADGHPQLASIGVSTLAAQVRREAASILTRIGEARYQNQKHDATLREYWLAAQLLRADPDEIRNITQLVALASSLGKKSHPAPGAAKGQVLSPADALQTILIADIITLTSQSDHQRSVAAMIKDQLNRYATSGDLETGLAQFVDAKVDNAGAVTITWKANLDRFPEGAFHREIVSYIALQYRAQGDAAYEKAASSVKPDANQSIQPEHRIALVLHRQMVQRYTTSTIHAGVIDIVNRYANDAHWEASRAGIDLAFGEADILTRQRLTALLLLRQADHAEQQQLQAGRKLGDDLPDATKAALSTAIDMLKTSKSEPVVRQIEKIGEALATRYVQLDRIDLAEKAIAAIAAGARGLDREFSFTDWSLWMRANLLERQAAVDLSEQREKLKGEATVKLSEHHTKEIALLDQLLQPQALERYRKAAFSRMMSIIDTYANLHAFGVAQSMLDDFGKKHAAIAAEPDFAYRSVILALRKADHAFAQTKSKLKPGEKPDKLSPEYDAAITALSGFLTKHPNGPLAHTAKSQLMRIVRTYGEAGAWDIARAVLERYGKAAGEVRVPGYLTLLEAATYLGELDAAHGLALLKPLDPVQAKSLATVMDTSRVAFDGEVRWQELMTYPADLAEGGKRKPGKDLAHPRGTTYGRASGDGKAGQGSSGGAGGASGSSSMDEAGANEGLAKYPNARPMDGTRGPDEKPTTSLALIRQAEHRQAQRLAMLETRRDRLDAMKNEEGQQAAQRQGDDMDGRFVSLPSGPVLSEAEMKRQDEAAAKAYALLIGLANAKTQNQQVTIGASARGEILWLIGFFEGQRREEQAIVFIEKFLTDRPDDGARVALAYRALNDRITWATRRQPGDKIGQPWLDKRHELFAQARQKIETFIRKYEEEKEQQEWVRQARLLLVSSYQSESRLAALVSPVIAGGLKVRAAEALLAIRKADPEHPILASIGSQIYNIAQELTQLQQRDQAIYLLSQIPIHFPTEDIANQAVFRMAQLHAEGLRDPLRAVETYQEYLSLTGQNVSSYIYNIGQQLAAQRRYVEALHVYGVFVDSFPNDPRAPQALLAIGQTHQDNQAWRDAIDVYDRLLNQYRRSDLVPQTKLAIAECRINLSQWYDARKLYEEYLQEYASRGGSSTSLAQARIPILKNLDRFQKLLEDKEITRNKDDAQFQIGRIVLERLGNRVKAIEEFRQVVSTYPKSQWADNAQLEVGKALLDLGQPNEAREALMKIVADYENSPLADNALYLIAKSFENQAVQLAAVSLEAQRGQLSLANQEQAYQAVQAEADRNRKKLQQRRAELSKSGDKKDLGLADAYANFRYNGADNTISQYARIAQIKAEKESALEAANRQDRINEAYREAVAMYLKAATQFPLGDRTAESLLQAAQILETRLKDKQAAMQTYQRIVKFFPASPVAEDAAWKVAQNYEAEREYEKAVNAYNDFIRKYPASKRVPEAQFAKAEALEQLGRWVEAMDAYEIFRERFAQHPKARMAEEQINWIKAYRK